MCFPYRPLFKPTCSMKIVMHSQNLNIHLLLPKIKNNEEVKIIKRNQNHSSLTHTLFFFYLGPGAYNTKDTITKRGGLMVTKDKRFKELKEDGPGPAAYEVCFSTPIIRPGCIIVNILNELWYHTK